MRSRKVSRNWVEGIRFHINLLISYMCILQIEGFFWTGCINHEGFIFWWISWPVVMEEMMTVLASRTHGLFLPFQCKQASLYVWLRMKLATPHLVWHRSQNLSLSKLETPGFVLEMLVWLSVFMPFPWFFIFFFLRFMCRHGALRIWQWPSHEMSIHPTRWCFGALIRRLPFPSTSQWSCWRRATPSTGTGQHRRLYFYTS